LQQPGTSPLVSHLIATVDSVEANGLARSAGMSGSLP
jgi:hypothetical protein